MRCCVRWPRAPTRGLSEKGARRTTATAGADGSWRSSSAIRVLLPTIATRRDDTSVSNRVLSPGRVSGRFLRRLGATVPQRDDTDVSSGPRSRGVQVELRPFGTTGIDVSAVGFGCWEIGGGYGSVEEDEFRRAVDRALDLGINCFDTAEGYGMGASEVALGKALGTRRDEAVIVTKFGMNYRDKPNLRDSSRERVLASIDKSLERLGTDHVDVFMIHWPDRETPFEETMTALDEVVRAGKARFVGVSNFKVEEIEACSKVRRVDVAQYGRHLFDRRMDEEVLPYCLDHGIGVMAYGSLAFGLLTGSFTEDHDFGSEDWRARQG